VASPAAGLVFGLVFGLVGVGHRALVMLDELREVASRTVCGELPAFARSVSNSSTKEGIDGRPAGLFILSFMRLFLCYIRSPSSAAWVTSELVKDITADHCSCL
jgi:hypothetical protein